MMQNALLFLPASVCTLAASRRRSTLPSFRTATSMFLCSHRHSRQTCRCCLQHRERHTLVVVGPFDASARSE
uniref:Putative secreted protein n=1 Tax=Anopheles triannulatus TaxID=58253 RepID=A0A2M4B788_9DIPT